MSISVINILDSALNKWHEWDSLENLRKIFGIPLYLDPKKDSVQLQRIVYSYFPHNPSTILKFVNKKDIRIQQKIKSFWHEYPYKTGLYNEKYRLPFTYRNIYPLLEPILFFIETEKPQSIILIAGGTDILIKPLQFFLRQRAITSKISSLIFNQSAKDTAEELIKKMLKGKELQKSGTFIDKGIYHNKELDYFASIFPLGNKILLIDDNSVTGGTLRSCKAALEAIATQPTSIYCSTLDSVSNKSMRVVDLATIETPGNYTWPGPVKLHPPLYLLSRYKFRRFTRGRYRPKYAQYPISRAFDRLFAKLYTAVLCYKFSRDLQAHYQSDKTHPN